MKPNLTEAHKGREGQTAWNQVTHPGIAPFLCELRDLLFNPFLFK